MPWGMQGEGAGLEGGNHDLFHDVKCGELLEILVEMSSRVEYL